jgi:hypothetical protein
MLCDDDHDDTPCIIYCRLFHFPLVLLLVGEVVALLDLVIPYVFIFCCVISRALFLAIFGFKSK